MVNPVLLMELWLSNFA